MKHHAHPPSSPTYPAPTQCPVCTSELRIERLHCDACGSALEGRFSLGRLARLTREQVAFVEVFVRCRGKIKDVEQALSVSYPTVVSRLDEVVRAMGFEVDPEDAARAAQRQKVLDGLAAGEINAQDAAAQLRALSQGGR
jgi:hypothetical protein